MHWRKAKICPAVLLAGVLAAASLSACGGGKSGSAADAAELAGAVAENLKKVESFSGGITLDFSADASVEQSGTEVNFDMKIGMDLDLSATREPAASKMEGTLSMSMMGQDLETQVQSYTVEENGETVSYADSGSGWSRSVQDNSGQDQDILSQNIYEDIAEGEMKAELEKDEATVNGQAAYVLTTELSGSTLEDFIEESFSGTNEMMGNGSLDWADGTAKLKIFIYKDSELPAKIQVDCRDFGRTLMESALSSVEEAKVEIGAFDMGMSFDEYNSVGEIQVPEDVVSSASDAGGDSDEGILEEELEDSGLEADETDSDSTGEPSADQDEEAVPNADGSYTIYASQSGHSATITMVDGQEYCYASPEDGYFSSMMSDYASEEDFSYIYQMDEYSTLEEAGKEYTDYSWMEEYDEYSGMICNGVQQMDVDGRTVYWTQLDYVYDSGYGASNVRVLYAWTQLDDILFTIELDDSVYEEGGSLTGNEQMLAEAMQKVVLE